MAAAEHRELGDVAPEEERHRPVDDDAELPRQQGELVQVIRPADEPAEEAAEAKSHHVGDSLVPAECGHLAQHPVAVGAHVATKVLGQPAGLAKGVLAGGRVGVVGRRRVGHVRAVSERPDVLTVLDA